MERDASGSDEHCAVLNDDRLCPEIGQWSKRKYHFLGRYLSLFSTGMKHAWPERHYLDLFSGAGVVRVRNTGERLLGSALIAATVRDPFTRLHLCEKDSDKATALKERLEEIGAADRATVYQGDANSVIDHMLARVPSRGALCITFADPYGLHLDYSTVAKIAQKRSDLIVLLADTMDALRNWGAYYLNNPDSPLDRFMGESGWREVMESSPSSGAAEKLRARYLARLREIGYTQFGHERVANSQRRDIYSLVYASRSSRGLDFWNKASVVDEGGQRKLFPD